MTTKRPAPSGAFKKGDPRINRKGRPKSFDALRELAQSIAHEVAKRQDKRTGEVTEIEREGHKVTIMEAIILDWATSREFQKQKAFQELAFGKVPDPKDETPRPVASSLENIPDDELNAELERLTKKRASESSKNTEGTREPQETGTDSTH
jgi:hypothetical protein